MYSQNTHLGSSFLYDGGDIVTRPLPFCGQTAVPRGTGSTFALASALHVQFTRSCRLLRVRRVQAGEGGVVTLLPGTSAHFFVTNRAAVTIMKITVCTRIGRGNQAGLGSRAGRSRYLRHTVDHVAPGGSCVGDGRWLRVYCYWIPAMAARKLPLALLNRLFAPHSRSIYRSIRLESPNTTH